MSSLNNLETLSSIFAGQTQEFETALQQVNTEVLNLDVAVGAQLDIIGNIVNLARQGLTDDTYRSRLRAQILVNASSGTAQDVIDILTQFLPAATVFTYREYDQERPGFEIDVTTILPTGIGQQAALTLRSSKAGGVNGYIIFHQSAPTFAFDGDGGAQFDSGGYLFKTALG